MNDPNIKKINMMTPKQDSATTAIYSRLVIPIAKGINIVIIDIISVIN